MDAERDQLILDAQSEYFCDNYFKAEFKSRVRAFSVKYGFKNGMNFDEVVSMIKGTYADLKSLRRSLHNYMDGNFEKMQSIIIQNGVDSLKT